MIVSFVLSLVALPPATAPATAPASTLPPPLPPATAPASTLPAAVAEAPPPQDHSPGTAARELVEAVAPTIAQTPWYGWLILLGFILLGLAGGKLVRMLIERAAEKFNERGWQVRRLIVRSAAGAASLAILGSCLGAGFGALTITSARLQNLIDASIQLIYIIAISWFLFNLVDLVDLGVRRLMGHREATRIDDTVLSLIRKALRIFLLVVVALFVAENVFEQDITAWLAGLGIAGLAVSLAAQDSIKNVFGSITVLIDRPFSLGDRIIFNGIDGNVESIGLRSTKIRTMQGNVVTVPNMKFTDGIIENLTTRQFHHRQFKVTLSHDTPPDKVREAMGIIADVLSSPDLGAPVDHTVRPPRIALSDFTSDSLSIDVQYWYLIGPQRDFWAFRQHVSDVNLRVLEALGRAGISVVLPSRTVMIAPPGMGMPPGPPYPPDGRFMRPAPGSPA